MMVMMMNCFYGMVDQQKTFHRQRAFCLISSWDHCQRSSSLWIFNTLWSGFELMQSLSSDFLEWSCAVVITTTSQQFYLVLFFTELTFFITALFFHFFLDRKGITIIGWKNYQSKTLLIKDSYDEWITYFSHELYNKTTFFISNSLLH